MAVYFKITCYDGGPRIRAYKESALLGELNQEDSGYDNVHFITFDELLKDKDPNYWSKYGDNCVLVIKGEVVVPQEKQKVTEWTFEKGD